jgi:Holliday junction resolvasome RuvABC endonuclease subunit
MVVVGVDYSISCPCICIYDPDKDPYFVFITNRNKYTYPFKYGVGLMHDKTVIENENQLVKFNANAELLVSVIRKSGAKNIFMEGYSYSSKGMVYNIGENAGIFKHKLLTQKLDYTVVAPTQIKKFATGKGNANKEKMLQSFIETTGIELENYGFSAGKNPSSDIVDSYFIAKYGYEFLQNS